MFKEWRSQETDPIEHQSGSHSGVGDQAKIRLSLQALGGPSHDAAPSPDSSIRRVGEAISVAIQPVNLGRGIGNALVYDYEHPLDTAEMVGTSALAGLVLKTALPEGGWGAAAAVAAIGGSVIAQALTPMVGAIKDAANAKTEGQIDSAAKEMDRSFGSAVVNTGVGMLGYGMADFAVGQFLPRLASGITLGATSLDAARASFEPFYSCKNAFWQDIGIPGRAISSSFNPSAAALSAPIYPFLKRVQA